MAASATTAAQAELISSLSQDEIPIKLRCAICSRLAVNVFRLPCCEQAICETCQSNLPSSCPVCEHTPVSAEDCKPNKSLRTTIKVFLRTEEKKRESLKVKDAKNTPPDTPVEVEATVVELPTPVDATKVELPGPVVESIAAERPSSTDARQEAKTEGNGGISEEIQEAQKDIPQQSIEIAPGQEATADSTEAVKTADGDEDQEDGNQKVNGQATDTSQKTDFGAGFGFDPTAGGGMGFGGDMNQMQTMMAMQNGISPAAFGNFPMMGMPGMGMNPIMMQNMMMNGGMGAGMGMNGMNMGMGMGGFDGGMNSGFNNGWNQQSWNIGPDNFNHANAAGMGHGDYGNNSGFNSHASGFNQGNYGRNQYNNYQNNSYGYQGRGRGRGRAGYHQNRGGYGYGSLESLSQQFSQQFGAQQPNGPISENGSVPTGPKTDAPSTDNVDEFGREIRKDTQVEDKTAGSSDVQKADSTIPDSGATATATATNGVEVNSDPKSEEKPSEEQDDNTPKPIQSLDTNQPVAFAPSGPTSAGGYNSFSPVDPNSRNFGYNRGPFQARGASYGNMQPPVKPVEVPINAPTGPKAMREGLPNTGLSSLRGRTTSLASKSGAITNGSVNAAAEKPDSRATSKERERSRSRDRHRDRSRERHHRRHRHRSTSLSEDEKESKRRSERRRERRRRRQEEEDEERDGVRDVEKEERRSRSASPAESKRSGHRSSRRDRDKYRERDDERDRKSCSSHKHRSSYRSRRDDRSRSRSRDREREHRHRKSRHDSPELDIEIDLDIDGLDPKDTPKDAVVKTPVSATTTEPENNASRRQSLTSINGGANGLEIKGASTRNKSVSETTATTPTISIPTGPKARSTTSKGECERDISTRHHHLPKEQEDSSSRRRSSRHRDHHTSSKEKEKEREKEKESGKAPAVQDPHMIEREARNRERLLKEAQRIAGLAGFASGGGRKRSREQMDDGVGARAGAGAVGLGIVRKKRISGRESEEERLDRLEAEREGGRWA